VLWIQILLISLAVSVDSLVVGISYGVRRVHISHWMMLLVASLSAILKVAAMLLGRSLIMWMSPATAPRLGAAILIGLGLWFLLSAAVNAGKEKAKDQNGDDDDTLLRFRLKYLGVVICVLQDPSVADMDDSRSISATEATLLGLALGFDALGAGISAGFLHLPVFFTAAAVGLGTMVLLSFGTIIGGRLKREIPSAMARALPGAILFILGFLTWLTA